MRPVVGLTAVFVFLCTAAFATIFGSVRGVIHDPQHRPVQGVHVTLKAQNSDWSQSQNSGDSGEFDFSSVPIGNYTVTVLSKGFQEMRQDVIVQSDTSPVLHFELFYRGCERNRLRFRSPSGRADGQCDTDYNGEPHRHPGNSRRRPHQRPGR